ncbi:MAG: GDSL-type esterase/lipase family protein [Pseudomonadota bacterium]
MKKYCRIAGVVALLGWHAVASAQQKADAVSGMVEQPCPPPVQMPDSARELLTDLFMRPHPLNATDFASLNGNDDFRQYLAAIQQMGNRDWPALCRFRADNARLQTADTRPQLVFMGDSITENWLLGDSALFDDNNINRGIGGQTTPQMLLRFRADVVALQPRFVHILAGTNDVAGNTGPTTASDYQNNIMSMVELAKANNIAVLLGNIPPAATFSWQPSIDPVPRIRELNSWLREYAAEQDLVYIDYYAALAGSAGELRSELGNDGVHPNRDGYTVMKHLLEQALARSK